MAWHVERKATDRIVVTKSFTYLRTILAQWPSGKASVSYAVWSTCENRRSGVRSPAGPNFVFFLITSDCQNDKQFLVNKVKYLRVAWLFLFNWMEDLCLKQAILKKLISFNLHWSYILTNNHICQQWRIYQGYNTESYNFKNWKPWTGLEPATLRLKVWCSTDWATKATHVSTRPDFQWLHKLTISKLHSYIFTKYNRCQIMTDLPKLYW